ncbi:MULTISPECIES: prolyl aminopeptidase [Gordonia]|uniref:Proline iminopeptidase n=1 Tax=Gordonia amicalis TaxID=89053 RepID=A0ABU4D986_9ACTN|nr:MULTISPECIES: prolyl aminopeptidase [Gordonia]ATD71469.1 prolyl aminopeptidase [Gordonia sp. 1D]MCR8896469.1 prolyl aminopeptidase [Gordonia sp. GONU]MCZ4650347.1 prolyl aminopeptidase [Gordonia amicalis]MDJ0452289.1 prolyl aminopeptidase [Gordonia amicalis]MDV6306300.1 prolyl aminopeptidase [Gordonia amicalis]
MRDFYPEIEPYESGHLDVGDGQQIYWETTGNPEGKPVVFVHGGPGGGTSPTQRRFFDPAKYRIVLFDQRGCGQSRPHIADGADLSVNTTPHLIADMERLRTHLGIDRWQVFGGSWGSTLGLAYAQTHPDRVTELVLRGIFLLRRSEIDWYYNGGAAHIFPDVWETYLDPIPENERDGDLVAAYHRLLTSDDAAVARAAARAWTGWEQATSYLLPRSEEESGQNPDDAHRFDLAFASIENHYFVNHGFLDDGQLLDNIDVIAHIPGVIVQGRYDVVCPMRSAWDLHRAWPAADLRIVDDAGHASFEEGIRHHLLEATDRFAE